MVYNKPPLSIDDQVFQLQSRGMTIEDVTKAKHYLTHIGYYRLSAYWLPYELPAGNSNSRNHNFKSGTTFEQVLNLYIFDRKLRLLVMEAIERIETATRSQWANAMAMHHGAHAHLRPELFKDPWEHSGEVADRAKELKKSNETFIVHYRETYSEPFLPPIWAVVQTMSLGTLSRWFMATADTKVKLQVIKSLRMPNIEVFEEILHALTPVRNVCAHHGRFWNRRFTIQLPNIKKIINEMVIDTITATSGSVQKQASRLPYNYLLIMAHMMQPINPRTTWIQRLASHVKTLSPTNQQAMGFPQEWQSMKIWQGNTP